MRRTSWYLGAAATLLVATSAVTRFAVLPAVHQVPDDTDFTMHFAGAMTMLDPQALQAGNLAGAIVRDVPVTADRRVKAVHTSGSTIVLSDRTVVLGPGKQTLQDADKRWAVDRETLLDKAAPDGVEAAPHTGLSAGFPLEPKRKDYPFWDAPTRTTVPATYLRTEKREGRQTYVFGIRTSGPVTDPASLAALPPAMPRAAVQGLSGVAFPDRAGAVGASLGAASDPVPLGYTSTTDMLGWVDSETGVTVDLKSAQSVSANTATPAGPVELFPVLALTMTTTPDSRAELADTAENGARALWLLGDVAPLAAFALALVLIAVAVLLESRARRPRGPRAVPSPRGAGDADTPTAGATSGSVASNPGEAGDPAP